MASPPEDKRWHQVIRGFAIVLSLYTVFYLVCHDRPFDDRYLLPPATVVRPQDNAFTYLRKLEALENVYPQVKEAADEEICTDLLQTEEARAYLKLYDQAATCEAVILPPLRSPTDQISYHYPCRTAFALASARGRCHAHSGDEASAWAEWLQAMAFSKRLEAASECSIDLIVFTTNRTHALSCMREQLAHTSYSADELDQIAIALLQSQPTPETWRRSVRREYMIVRSAALKTRQRGLTQDSPLRANWYHKQPYRWLQIFAKAIDPAIHPDAPPYTPADKPYLHCTSRSSLVRILLQRGSHTETELENLPVDPIINLAKKVKHVHAEHLATVLLIAGYAYQIRHGEWPAHMDDLPSALTASLPDYFVCSLDAKNRAISIDSTDPPSISVDYTLESP